MTQRNTMRQRLTAALMGVILFGLALGAAAQDSAPLQDSIRENTQKLSELRSRIRAQQERMDALASQADEVRRSFAEIEEEIELSQRLTSEMAQREAELSAQSAELAEVLARSRGSYVDRKAALARNLRRMYVRGQRNELEMALTADSFSDLLTRMKVARLMARLEAGVLTTTRDEGARIHREQRLLDAALAEIWQAREEKRGEADRLEDLLAERMAALRELETEHKGAKNRLLELSLSEQKLNYILEDLEQQRTEQAARDTVAVDGNVGLAALSGRLDWPAHGELVRSFGRSVHPQFKTVTVNNGYNIATGAGAPVAAVAQGRVEFADHLPGFGRCVILDHGEGYYTLYARLDGVFVGEGEQVARGQVLAEVAAGSGGEEPQLYFEIRQGRTPLDPGDWLKAR